MHSKAILIRTRKSLKNMTPYQLTTSGGDTALMYDSTSNIC
jgi:hypothetical protein